MVDCPACGNPNTEGANFCSRCGERLRATMADTTRTIPAINDEGRPTATPDLSAEVQAAVNDLPEGHALLIVARGPDEGARYLLDTDEATAGRHPDSEIFLDDITVSRHHVRFVRAGESFSLEDLGSLNGTYINRQLVEGQAPLRPGDEVQIGKYRMVFCVSERGLR